MRNFLTKTEIFLVFLKISTYDLNFMSLVLNFLFEKISEQKKIVFSKKKFVFRLSFLILIFN